MSHRVANGTLQMQLSEGPWDGGATLDCWAPWVQYTPEGGGQESRSPRSGSTWLGAGTRPGRVSGSWELEKAGSLSPLEAPGSTRPGLPLRRATPAYSSCPAELCAEAWGAWAVRYLSVDRTLTEEQKGVSEIPRGAPSPN